MRKEGQGKVKNIMSKSVTVLGEESPIGKSCA
jgi:hypothetical protein